MSHRSIIISASNDYYWPLLADLVRSLRDCKTGVAFDIGVLDLGLSPQNREKLAAYGVIVQSPGIDIEYPDRERWEQAAFYFRAMTARPSLPKYFPSYDAYMWIDADAWVQTPEAIETMLPPAAADENLYIAAEYDAAYSVAFSGGLLWEGWINAYLNCFPQEIALGMRLRPMLNSGVFALAPRAPHWRLWHQTLSEALVIIPEIAQKHYIIEQLALNVTVHRDHLPVQIMPSEYNWIASSGPPLWDEAAQLYVRPFPPHRPISIMHLAAQAKNAAQTIRTTGGRVLERPLTYTAAIAEKTRAA